MVKSLTDANYVVLDIVRLCVTEISVVPWPTLTSFTKPSSLKMDTHFGIAGAQNLNCTKIVVRLKVVLMMKLLLEILLNISQRSILPSSQQYQCASSLYNDFLQAKENALRALTEDWLFDTELISKVIAELKKLWACCWYKRTHSRAFNPCSPYSFGCIVETIPYNSTMQICSLWQFYGLWIRLQLNLIKVI